MKDKKQAYEKVLSMIKTQKEVSEECKKSSLKDSNEPLARIFGYEAKLCQEFIDTIEGWIEGEYKAVGVEDELEAATREIQKRKADKELMNSKCAGELGVWNA